MAFKKTFICPYCFSQHKIKEAEFRCTNKRCKDFDDIEMTTYENGDLNKPLKGKKTFKADSKISITLPKYAFCPECEKKTFKVVCPSCHNALPEATLFGRDMIISIVGSRDTGKSHFIGVIIKELIERISIKFGGNMVANDDDTIKRYETFFGRKLYTDLQKLDLTVSSERSVNNGAYKPLIYILNFPHKFSLPFFNNPGKEINSFTFVFFDTAGEDLNSEDTMSTLNKYICNSSGIIFLLDPMQISAVRNQLKTESISRSSSVNWESAARSDDIMARVSRLIRNNNNLPSKLKIDIPVAAVFSKFDAIYSIIPEGSTVLETSPHCANKSFVLSDWHNVNQEVQGLLKEWGADSFMSQLEINYSNYSYFAVSSLGLDNNPREDGGIERPRPHRIEDPLLWLLMENKVIESSK